MIKNKKTRLYSFLAVFFLGINNLHGKTNDSAFVLVSELLINKNIPREFVVEAFSSSSIALHKEIRERFFSPYEKKPYEEYKKIFITKNRIEKGVAFYKEHKGLIEEVASSFNIDSIILLSIAGVESNFGRIKGHYTVFNALYTIIHTLPKKKKWAAKELAEYLEYCYSDGINPHSLRGSYAGAFGFGQFIPSSFNGYAVDFDRNGTREPFGWPDVLASMANYLKKNGYKKEGREEKGKRSGVWNSIYAYNHSSNYVMVVLELCEELRTAINESD